MAKFNYKKWVTENKYGKNLYEQGTADFEVKEQTSGSAGSGSAGSGSTGGNTGSGSTGGNTGSGSTGGSISKSADLDKDGKLSSYEKVRGAAIEKNMRKYKAGRTQGNGNPLLPEQIFGMQHSSKPPKQETISEMNSYYEQMGCEGIQKMYAEYYYTNKKLMTKENGTGPYEYSNVMQEGDNPEQQGSLVSNMNYLSELAPSGCNEMAKIQEINGNFNLHENKITKRTTKRTIKNIIREELKKSLLKEVWTGEGCDGMSWPTQASDCAKCQSFTFDPINNFLPYIGSGAQNTGPQCQCCDDERSTGGEDIRGCLNPAQPGVTNQGMPCPGSVGTVTLHHEPCCTYEGGGSDDPCKDNPNPECFWCNNEGGPSCVPVGANLAYAQSNGFSLYQNSADCNAAEPGCKREDPGNNSLKCHCCSKAGAPESPIPNPNYKSCSSYNGQNGLYGCQPTNIPLKCKKPLPTGGIPVPLSPALGESRRLRKEIQRELFGK